MTFTIEVTEGPRAPKEWRRGYLSAKNIHDRKMTDASITQAVARYGQSRKPPLADTFDAGWAAFFWCVQNGVEL